MGALSALGFIAGQGASNIMQERQASFENQLKAQQMQIEQQRARLAEKQEAMQESTLGWNMANEEYQRQTALHQRLAAALGMKQLGDQYDEMIPGPNGQMVKNPKYDPTKLSTSRAAMQALAGGAGDADVKFILERGFPSDEAKILLENAKAQQAWATAMMNNQIGQVISRATGTGAPTGITMPGGTTMSFGGGPAAGGGVAGGMGSGTAVGKVNNPALYNTVQPKPDGLYAIGPDGTVYKLSGAPAGGTP